jgi:hypothetical protein
MELVEMQTDVAFDAHVLLAMLAVISIASIYFAGRVAEKRGRRFATWAWIAAIVGPLAFPLIYLFPDLHRSSRRR